MNDTLETVKYRGFTINIVPDSDCENPLTYQDQPKGMLFFTSTRRDPDHYWVGGVIDGPRDINRFLRQFAKDKPITEKSFTRNHYWLPIYKFEHSGVAYQTTDFGDRWDSGLVGMVSIPKSTAKSEWREDPQKGAENWMKGNVEEFSFWANGQCFGYTVAGFEDDDAGFDSCWGFVGDDYSPAIEQAKSNIDSFWEDSPDEAVKYLWQQAVSEGETELGLKEWTEEIE